MRYAANHITSNAGHETGGAKGKNFFQPKLSINPPNDIYEQEADSMADRVMRMSDDATHQPFLRSNSISRIQRKCQHCEEEEEKTVQRKEGGEPNMDASTENYISSLSGGKALDKTERSFFEPRMGCDLSNVRLHTDGNANQSAKNINALAYTHGNNVVFGPGQYQPGTDTGKKLIAHELTHTVQQTGAIQRAPTCSYEKMQNEITGVGKDTKYLKAKPDGAADNFPGEPVVDGDAVVVKNTGGAATYNNVKNCTWAWVEVPGKKSTDKSYPVLHGFIEVSNLKSTPVKKEEPGPVPGPVAPSPSEIVGNIAGPEIIYPGGAFQYTASPLGPLDNNVDLSGIKWAFKYDSGAINTLETTNAVTIVDRGSTLNVSIPAAIKAGKFTLYAFTTSAENGASKESSLQAATVVESSHGKGTNADGTVADDMKYHDFTKQDIKDLGTLFTTDEWANYTDDQLFEFLKKMATDLFSTGDLETNNLAMIDHFKDNTGTDYSNPILTKAVQKHESTQRFIEEIKVVLSRKVLAEKEALSMTSVTKGELDDYRPVYNSTGDTFAGGLTFAINDTWAHKADVVFYDYVSDSNFKGKLKVFIYDDFGLDKPDVIKKYGYLQGFRAWFILQHERGYKPFVTVVELELPFDQSITEIEPKRIAEKKAAEERAKLEKTFKTPPGGAKY